MDKNKFSSSLNLKNVKINDEFWSDIQNRIIDKVIPYQYEALNDRIPNAEKSYCVENFKKAANIVEKISNGISMPHYPVDKWCYDESNSDKNAFHGWVFQDSDAYKWLEAVAYSLTIKWNDELYSTALELIRLIASAQLENGYLDTLYIINNPNEIFTNLRDFHELYCFGHLAEAGVAFYEATNNRELLDCALKFADLICDTFNENNKLGYDGHEIAELAMVKLYKTTGDKKYLTTAQFFIDQRGTKPYYFDIEHGKKTITENYHYNQAHIPPRQQTQAVGHAVRGVYLYSGMADIAKEKQDEELYSACKSIWEDITTKKMYITGGIGSTVDGEAFSFEYDLPNDLAYCETCASIGLVFFAQRMLEINPNAQIGDTIERALYNTILSAMNNEGDSFFYVNPLEVLPKASHSDSRKKHIKPVRQKWFGCACCPPNLARILTSLPKYCFAENENTFYVNQIIGCDISSNLGQISIKSSYTKSGTATIIVKPEKQFKLAIRIPAWCDEYTFSQEAQIIDGYAVFDITNETEISIAFTLEPKLIKCSNQVRENVGKLALTYGPFVYCLEEKDNGSNLQMLKFDIAKKPTVSNNTIIANGFREETDTALYSKFSPVDENPCELKFIPYFQWGNRGENEMTVYFRY